MWKLKDEDTDRLFTHEIAARNDDVAKADDIQKKDTDEGDLAQRY